MMGAFNDPRLMRLGLLAQERHCAENAPRPPPGPPAEACANTGDAQATPSIPRPAGKESSGPADPFAPKGKSAPAPVAPAGSDPFARR